MKWPFFSNQKPLQATNLKPQKGHFRLNARNIFLTYSQCGIKPIDAFSMLRKKLPANIIVNFLIVQEHHADGLPHLHILLSFNKRYDIRSARKLDLAEFHGKYQVATRLGDLINYMAKSLTGDPLELANNTRVYGSELYVKKLHLAAQGLGTIRSGNMWPTLISLARQGKIQQALQVVELLDPKLYLTQHVRIEKSLRSLHVRSLGFKTRYNIKDFIIPKSLEDLLQHCLDDSKETLYIHGAPGTGKTELMQSFLLGEGKSPLIISHPDGLKNFNEALHTDIILDDCTLSDPHLMLDDRETVIALLDKNKDANIRILGQSVLIPKGTNRWILSNRKPEKWFPFKLFEDPAIKRRVKVIDLGITKLYKLEPTVEGDKDKSPSLTAS